MPKRALIERRPWLLAAIVAAVLFLWCRNSTMPGLYLLALKALPFLLLAVYSVLRHRGKDTRTLAAMLVLEGTGAALNDLYDYPATVLIIIGHAMGISLFLNHLRRDLAMARKIFATALLLLTPLVFLLLTNTGRGAAPAFQGLALGGMAASAWASTFVRAQVGSGALMVVVACLIALEWPSWQFAWPLFFVGNLVLATGVTGELRSRPT